MNETTSKIYVTKDVNGFVRDCLELPPVTILLVTIKYVGGYFRSSFDNILLSFSL